MKLYYSPASCSLAPHIILQELQIPFSTERVDLKTKTSASGDFKKINPKGYVPVLELDSKERLTEASVILQYLGDQKPEVGLIPPAGTMERYRLQEWLNFVATEFHKGIGSHWNDKLSPEAKAVLFDKVKLRLDYLNEHFSKNTFLWNNRFSLADAYLFTILNWCGYLKIDLSKWTAVVSYLDRIRTRPSVQAALKAEGLLKAA
jgi:glutathione S-transferase